ncbi:uncharacterized protein LOC129564948 [Sitodiplosis mosellana]|uniref:uncharacterized protein LOC129564948 n=1 Tax=Sitodiplosis mosellana TaxID=263140 RepID=UPI0024453891|nr:uncharacterized protein LOC129564948 [Sitodiplosis mosellana]
MLWKKESNDRNAMYVDLFESSLNAQEPVEVQYLLNKMSRLECNTDVSYYKNDVIANTFRQFGNKKFEKGQFYDAMELYNKSLCFANNGSKALGLGYANRSTCFFQLKMFKKCLADIELAKQNNCPAHLIAKLNGWKNDCLKLMETEPDQSEMGEPKLDFAANEQFPCLANVVNMQSNDEFGHHIVATEDIEIGKTVLIEPCYIGVTKFDHYKCTSALFCLDCKENNLHGIECDMNFGCPAGFKFMDVVRSITLAKNAFSNADELTVFVEDMLNSDAIQPSNLVDERSKYRAFFQLCPDWQTYELHLQQAYLFYQLLLEQRDMKAFFHTKAHQRFLMHLVQHHISMILRGAFNKRSAPIGGVNITDTYVNIVAKYLHHSCIPNVCHVFKDGSINCIVIRPIKKNEQLFISYITWDMFASEAERRAILQSRYVKCKCLRCKLKSLPSDRRMQSDDDFQFIEKTFKMHTLHKGLYNRKQIDSMKEKCFRLLQTYGPGQQWTLELLTEKEFF